MTNEEQTQLIEKLVTELAKNRTCENCKHYETNDYLDASSGRREMTKTWLLYRCSPLLWAGLEYEDALSFRIDKAREAMNFYREESKNFHWLDDSGKDKENTQRYVASEKAMEFNRDLLEEIKEERKENAKKTES